MFVVLDSSIICQDLRFTGNSSRVLISNHRAVPITLAIPDVVIDEVTNHFREKLLITCKSWEDLHTKLKLLVPEIAAFSDMPIIEQETERYRQFLSQQILDLSGRVLPYPKIPHQTIVKRELQRRKPFKENGSGYRDLLIWESLRQLTWSGHERIAFITANIRDFMADARLHNDLAADVLNPDRIEVFTSLKEFNEKHIIPRLELTSDSIKNYKRSQASVRMFRSGFGIDFSRFSGGTSLATQ